MRSQKRWPFYLALILALGATAAFAADTPAVSNPRGVDLSAMDKSAAPGTISTATPMAPGWPAPRSRPISPPGAPSASSVR